MYQDDAMTLEIMEQYDLFICKFCDEFLENSDKASCETIDVDVCSGCHRWECGNINLCESAGNF